MSNNSKDGDEEEKIEEILKQSLLENEDEQENLVPLKAEGKLKGNALENASIVSKLSFYWVYPFMKLGNQKYLEQSDHDPLRSTDECAHLFKKFEKFWNQYKNTSKYPLYRTFFSSERSQIFLCFFLQFICSSMDLIKPVMIGVLIEYAGRDDKSFGVGFMFLILMIFITVFQSWISLHSDFQFNILGYNLNNQVVIALFQKSLKVSLNSNKDYKTGQIINIAQVDANRIYLLCNQIASLVFLPVQLVVGLYLIYAYVGVSFIGGLIVIIILGAANYFITKLQVKYQKILMTKKDGRMKVTNEIFGQIKFIKVNAWEEFFYDRLNVKREDELATLKTKIYVQILSIIVFWLTSPLIINAVFAWYSLAGNKLTADVCFPVISLFNALGAPIQGIPAQITNIIETYISVKRIQSYLQTEEINFKFQILNNNPDQDEKNAIVIKSGNFSWGKPKKDEKKQEKGEQSKLAIKEQGEKEKKEKENETQQNAPKKLTFQVKSSGNKNTNLQQSYISDLNDKKTLEFNDTQEEQEKKGLLGEEIKEKYDEPLILKDINLEIPRGKIVAFIGDVGSGKSSILECLVGEMKYDPKNAPRVEINGKLSLVNQKPWIMSDTIQNNIIFGFPFDQEKYDECIKYAQLQHDFTVLNHGDQTMIGEKGVNLSGGQKARIALARAIYADSDILLLDDILSAVDIHVGKSIVKDCLLNYKKGCTIILVTHALYYMKYMDYIYLMDNGKIEDEGTYDVMKNTEHFVQIYEKFMKHQYTENADDEIEKLEEQEAKKKAKEEANLKQKLIDEQLKKEQEEIKKKKKKSSDHIQEEGKKDLIDDLIMEEDRKKGQVGLEVWKDFIVQNGGWWFITIIIFASTLSQAFRVMSQLWLLVWTSDSENENHSSNYYVGIFTLFSFGIALGAGMRSSVVLLCIFRTGKFIHRKMIVSLLYAPLNEFFDRIPLGRILNRLSKDLTILDTMIAFSLASFMASLFTLLGTVYLTVYASSYWVLIPIVIYLGLCIYVYKFYITANRELVRLEGITKSPVVSYFQETLNGLDSVRTYQKQDLFLTKHCHHIDENKKNQIMVLASNIFFRMELAVFSIIINMTSISFSVFSGSESQSRTGLLLTYAVGLDWVIRWMVMMMGWFEQRLVSFERCSAFLEIESEQGYRKLLTVRDQYVNQNLALPKNEQLKKWPHEGVIEFKDVHVKYRKNLDTVLKGVSLTINQTEKVGIVGRTGAGKSTITLCLLRVLELYKGQIIIDGQDISKLSLDELRSKITIILQDPQLFEGKLRQNIDPLNLNSDQEIEETLRKCNLEKIFTERDGLDTHISENGGNLSVGEKQLICIARALLKKSKVVLIDEATANIDIQTEHMVQETIKKVFENCTVLTIAHRLNTILGSDRILVLNNGLVDEFDSPKNLLQNPNSLFYKLHEEALNENQI
ncbi:P-loop containing nucleoside triphosphate hydrolase [Pseudocohnilembus persalinus]|uniref:p-loop containing nucleoside triphosphate hydrolase n=1 Tax=Pseudocohnilembus persalinus TaxID=266149 RepID=A0A0V0R084_PSEPJ|nr:P-loop containing nucleoside triphosphate hydrolase [Pseudocohnilembus persalinus]|eukprot:KRX07923.1 P-loop containing nucleoside triphosphate hydrolase [Pseudocohnilembus persalinus]